MYSRGLQRLFYQSNNELPQNVTVNIINPKLKTVGPFNMSFISDGLYYVDVTFMSLGPHIFYIYEEGVKKHSEILRVTEGKYIIYPHFNIV